MKPAYELNGAVYAFIADQLPNTGNSLLFGNYAGEIISQEEAIDIDTEKDLKSPMPYSQPNEAPTLSDLFSLKGKNALVIGGSGLLGGEISYAFAEMGARLIISNRNSQKTETFIETLSSYYPTVKATALPVDISSKTSIATFAKQVTSELDEGLDILVNCGWSGNKNSLKVSQMRIGIATLKYV